MCEMTQEAMREKSNKIYELYHSSYMDFPNQVRCESLMKSLTSHGAEVKKKSVKLGMHGV